MRGRHKNAAADTKIRPSQRDGTGAGCDAPVVNEYVYMIRGTGAVIKS